MSIFGSVFIVISEILILAMVITRIENFLYINFQLIILRLRTDEGQVLARTGPGPAPLARVR